MKLLGFLNGFRGLAQDRTLPLSSSTLSGILTDGGTILGTSRDKPHRMPIGGKTRDMTKAIVDTYHRHHLDALVCLGGGGTQRNALHLQKAGLNIVTMPKTIDNDIAHTDRCFGFDTAVGIATEAIDRLHSTATSHNRIIVVEVMGHNSGWLALEAGIAGGADVILLPEIPYDIEIVAESIRNRTRRGKRFSIVVVAEGAMSIEESVELQKLLDKLGNARDKETQKQLSDRIEALQAQHVDHTIKITRQLQKLTMLESRMTILGHIQRGGTPSSADRVFATWLGTSCAEVLHKEHFGVMLALQNNKVVPIQLTDVAGRKRYVPTDHSLIRSAKLVGTSFGD